ncbi:MAG: glutamine synthetase [Clostridia bacterium]|nr:glutamine synthetase [Clostridia bacterium]
MPDFEFEKMLFKISPKNHSSEEIRKILGEHPEVKFVSLVGFDIAGNDTDAKIPVGLFLEDLEKFMKNGVQTDGSSVVLPKIANLNNAKVDIIPDRAVNWYVDYNLNNVDEKSGLPVGTLRIPSFLIHNDTAEVGSRVILRDAVKHFKKELLALFRSNPYIFEYLPIDSVEEIEEVILTSATELEFWVKTPDDKADREQLSTAQILKEQYWKRTVGPVRTALEKTLMFLENYGFGVEMGHKEVGGIKAKMGHSGHYDHVMEQLEIDWKYAAPVQAADNENQIKHIVKDVFRSFGLDVTFMAKPIEGVAGSGEHTHMGLSAKLKNGKYISLFAPEDMQKDFLNPVGFGALLGILKNYEVINPFVSSSNDAFNRLKPGYEAPVCIVTSIGHSVQQPSRNRTVLAGLVRDASNPLATRFELRSPNPKSNTYLIIAASYLAMLDGIRNTLEAKKTSADMLASLSKDFGQEDFYLEKDRVYRSEKNVFDEYSQEERDRLFGHAPKTVWENLKGFEKYPEKTKVLLAGGVITKTSLESYKQATLDQWATELHNRIIPNTMDMIRECVKLHNEADCTDFDLYNWSAIQSLKKELGRDTISDKCLLTKIKTALDEGDYDAASDMQIEMQKKLQKLIDTYIVYKKNMI